MLAKIDSNVDGKISQEEFAAVGLGGLPNFDHMGAEGHHYDVESEFCVSHIQRLNRILNDIPVLHHEEQFHSTPETQTDESYTHPEDAEHFAAHAKIEQREAEREAKFIGITVEEALKQHEQPHAPEEPKVADQQVAPQDPLAAHPHDEQVSPQEPLQEPPRARQKLTRVTPPEKQAPEVKYKDARASGAKKGEWGTGEGGYKPPVEPGDKMRWVHSPPFGPRLTLNRRNLPYKVSLPHTSMPFISLIKEYAYEVQIQTASGKVHNPLCLLTLHRRNWGDF